MSQWQAVSKEGHLYEYKILRFKADGTPVLAKSGKHSTLCGACEKRE